MHAPPFEIAAVEADEEKCRALLLAGWLRSRMKREISLTRRNAEVVEAIWVDGEAVGHGGDPLSSSELLSGELDQFGRDPVYEAAVRAALPASIS